MRFKQLEDLKGYVLVDTGQQALRFVRLRSSLSFEGAFQSTPYIIELVDKERVTSEFLLGRVESAKDLLETGLGIVDDGPALAEVRAYPRIRKDGSGFIITRLVAKFEGSPFSKQCKIEESVGRDGSYKVLSLSPIRKGPISELLYSLKIEM